MRVLQNIFIVSMIVAASAVAAFGQKDGDKKPVPPKDPPPVVKPEGQKPPPTPRPKQEIARLDVKLEERAA